MKATVMDSSVSMVRSFLRFRLLQTRYRYLMTAPAYSSGSVDSRPLFR
jgi:hypothetical protein